MKDSLNLHKNKVIGYGVCGKNERYLENTLKEFKRLCDHTIIVCNNTDKKSKDLIKSYGFDIVVDNRVWGENQHKIKEDFVKTLGKYNPDWLICLDMDEVFDPSLTREKFEEYTQQCESMYVYIVNLWGTGWKREWSFWNIRAWKWKGESMTKFVNRPLHCGLAPEWAYHYGTNVPVILWHYGLKDTDVRKRKIDRYRQFDPKAVYRDKSYYDALSSKDFEEINTLYIQESIEKETLPLKKKKILQNNAKEFVYVMRNDGKILDIPKESLTEHLKRGFKLYEN